MSQYEQENDLGRGGGEVDDDTMRDAWEEGRNDRPNRAPEQERPSEPRVPGPGASDEAQ
ncbi:MAG: hypothetical protein M3310_05870 [Actinomycetota bacterium]|nr:hypothetical protein [Actinomycetota bacterium]